MKTTGKLEALRILRNGNLTTAHQIARISGYTPQHINRCLKELFAAGVVAFCIIPHRGNAKQKRKWCMVKDVEKWGLVYPFVMPEYTQMEMEL